MYDVYNRAEPIIIRAQNIRFWEEIFESEHCVCGHLIKCFEINELEEITMFALIH